MSMIYLLYQIIMEDLEEDIIQRMLNHQMITDGMILMMHLSEILKVVLKVMLHMCYFIDLNSDYNIIYLYNTLYHQFFYNLNN